MFKIGDVLIYPLHGIGAIKGIVEREVFGKTISFYEFFAYESKAKILIPDYQINERGLRKIIKKNEVSQVMSILKKKAAKPDARSWALRYREYHEKLAKGNIFDVAQVVTSIHHQKIVKQMSFGDRKLMESALKLLVSELAAAQSNPEWQIRKDVDEALGSTSL